MLPCLYVSESIYSTVKGGNVCTDGFMQIYVFVFSMCHYLSVFAHSKNELLFSPRLPGLTPLHLAVLRGHKDLARMLLDAGADINAMVSPHAALIQR